MPRLTKLLISLALPIAAGLVGSLFTMSAIPTWYATLTKPSFSPPNWIFAPVWTGLYLLMGLALYRIVSRNPAPGRILRDWSLERRQAATLFGIHLVFNALWSILFFGLHNPLLGLLDILILLSLIVIITIKFYRLDRVAAYLLLPYLVWVAFATLLNFSIWQLN